MASGTRIWTVGHGAASAVALVGLLEAAGIETVVDVRRFPGSRRHPYFGREAMAAWLAAAGLDYRWMEDLGGRRPVRSESPVTVPEVIEVFESNNARVRDLLIAVISSLPDERACGCAAALDGARVGGH